MTRTGWRRIELSVAVVVIGVLLLLKEFVFMTHEFRSGRELAAFMAQIAKTKGYVAASDFPGGVVCIALAEGSPDRVAKRFFPSFAIGYVETDDSNGMNVSFKNKHQEIEVYRVVARLRDYDPKKTARAYQACPQKIFVDTSAKWTPIVGFE